MSHLGDRIAALVDGELSHEARDRTLAHLAGCPECRAEAEAVRRTKQSLARLDAPGPSAELMSSLLALAEPGPPLPPDRRSFPGSFSGGGRPPTVPAPARRRPAGAPAESRRPGDRQPRRLRFVTVGALSGFAIVMGTAFAAGGVPEEPGTPLTPPIDRYQVEHAATTGEMSFVDPAFATLGGSFGGAFQPAFSPAVPSYPVSPSYPLAPSYSPLTGASLSGVQPR